MGFWAALNARLRLRSSGRVILGENVSIEGIVHCPGHGVVRIGDGVQLRAGTAPIELRADNGGEIVLGDGVIVESGCSIEALDGVHVGARSRLGAFSKLMDNHFHEIGDRRLRPPSHPVIVEEDVVVGPRAVLLPGACIGRGSRVGPSTVIPRRMPPGVEISGNPPTVRRLR